MKRLLLACTCAASILFLSTVALADDADVLVVDVVSASLDAAAIRASIGKELGKEVVAPEDARASTAKGWLTVEPHEGKLTVTYRPLGAIVARTVDLPNDETRARRLAALLAGNVARDEASELAESMKKKTEVEPIAPLPPPSFSPTQPTSADQLRAILVRNRDADRKARTAHGFIAAGIAAAALGPGLYFELSTSDHERLERSFGAFLISTSIVNTTESIVDFAGFIKGDEDELLDRLDGELKSGSTPAQATALVESSWRYKAESAQQTRETSGIVLGILGAAGVGMGVALPVLAKDSRGEAGMYTFSEVSIGVGALFLALAPVIYFNESRAESTFHTYDTMVHPPPAAAFQPQKPHVAFAPTPGGGGVATVGFVF